jgi:hypothetical protein
MDVVARICGMLLFPIQSIDRQGKIKVRQDDADKSKTFEADYFVKTK